MSVTLPEIRNRYGERLDVTYEPAPGSDRHSAPVSIVVLGHGVTAHKDRPWLVALADALSAAGLASLRVSFAGNGGSDGRFEDSVPSKEVEDLGSVFDALTLWGVQRIAYVGHSMGGAVGVLRASMDSRIVPTEQPWHRSDILPNGEMREESDLLHHVTGSTPELERIPFSRRP